jgi:glycosyltransferase involved in cell wall biosynthesis
VTDTRKPRLLIIGVHPISDGYPNIRFRIEGLLGSSRFSVTHIHTPAWTGELDHRGKRSRWLERSVRAFYAHLAVLIEYFKHKDADRIYIPYPAVFVSVLFSLLPRRLRPKCIILDAFISLYDTIVIDREYIPVSSWLARLLKGLEGRGLAHADVVITDTRQSSRYLCKLFGLDIAKVIDLPLATDERHFRPMQPKQPCARKCTVLFIGTLVPLHGIETILQAIGILRDRQDIGYKVIGDGQTAPAVEEFLRRNPGSLEWVRSWKTAAALAEEIGNADICLGVFGTGAKAQRVCPLKLYMYAACGKAVITGDSDWTRDLAGMLSYSPFRTSAMGDGAALAKEIERLADSSLLRDQLGAASRRFYVDKLSNSVGLAALEDVIGKSCED